MGGADYRELVEFKKRLEALKANELLESMTKEAGNRLLAKVIDRTPVDTGELRQGWFNKKNPSDVVTDGFNYTTKISNNVGYASYVEFGHRQEPGRYVPAIGKRLKKAWVDGQYFLTKSEMELERELPQLIDAKLNEKLGELFK